LKTKENIILFTAIILIASMLRAPITGVGSVVSTIGEDLSLSSSASGFLTTIPLLAFGLLSVLVGKFSQQLGVGRMILGGLLFLTVGIIARSYTGITGLFAGTAVIGMGIAIGNVLVPAIVKASFPTKVGIMTSAYTTAMSVFSGIAGGISVPLTNIWGWEMALFIWIVLPLLTIILWLPQIKMKLKGEPRRKGSNIIKDSTTWWIAIYMGVQSMLFYCFVAWFATILQSYGYDQETAGYYNSAYLFLGIPGSILIPAMAGKRKSQSGIAVALSLLYIVGIGAMLFAKNQWALLLAVICCGFCSGSCIALAMALFGLHTKNAADTSALSGLAQSVGYILAALGPIIMGKLFDLSGSWTVPMLFLLGTTIILTGLGYMAGRDRIINEPVPESHHWKFSWN